MNETKACYKCNLVKPVSEFYLSYVGRPASYCKPCSHKSSKATREKLGPRDKTEKEFNASITKHIGGKPFATCFNCRGDDKKIRVSYLSISTIDCPDCKHALYWERLEADQLGHHRRKLGQRNDWQSQFAWDRPAATS